jgi:hypothetical protein
MAEAEIELLPGGFISDLISLVKRILLRILGFRLPLRLKRPSSILPEIASVRQVYRQLLRWAAAGGYPRQISQTPHAYLYTLVGMLPVVREDLHLITQHYVKTRYGTFLPTEDELQEVRQSWHKIKQNRLKKPKSETDAK